MLRNYVKWVLAALAAAAVPFVLGACVQAIQSEAPPLLLGASFLWAAALTALIVLVLSKSSSKILAFLDPIADQQSSWISTIAEKRVWLSIFCAAALSLYLELSLIRWQASVFELFSFYKNFSLLACFAGLGIGYALSSERKIPLVCTIPLLVFQQLVLVGLRYGPFHDYSKSLNSALLMQEQLSMGITAKGASAFDALTLYYLLSVVIVLTMLCMVPVGQLCGQLMSRLKPLPAYGANLLGSLFGIVAMTTSSIFITPPTVWFVVVFGGLLFYCLQNRASTVIGLAAAMLGLLTLSWNVSFGSERVFSPYQLVERGVGEHGWTVIRAAGFFYHNATDLSTAARKAWPELQGLGLNYDLPYSYHSAPDSVVIFGAGLGNDVAAALRHGPKKVYAVEIDPCIAEWSKTYHPEAPMEDKRVELIVNDARAFLRKSEDKYDMIVFGLLDSHALSGHASSLRVDSYVYTVESFREARERLKDGGVVALSFAALDDNMVRKLNRMMTQAFDGHPPVVVATGIGVAYLQNKEGNLKGLPVTRTSFPDMTESLAKDKREVDCSTDDWPFFYMPRRVWPLSYLPLLGLLLVFTASLNRSLGGSKAGISSKNAQFFFLGAGFMLIEAKAITELGLNFGNTWQITGAVIAAVLGLGFAGNLLVQYVKINAIVAYGLVLLMLLGGWWIAGAGGFPSTMLGNLETIGVLIGPVVFSGIAFSSLLSSEKDVSAAMSWNLLGAMLGGVLEYCALNTGYRALYLVAMGIYAAALLCYLLPSKKEAVPAEAL